MAILRRHGGPSEKVVLLGGPRDGEELMILDTEALPPEIPDDIQGGYRLLAPGRDGPERDRRGRPIYHWAPPEPPPATGGAHT